MGVFPLSAVIGPWPQRASSRGHMFAMAAFKREEDGEYLGRSGVGFMGTCGMELGNGMDEMEAAKAFGKVLRMVGGGDKRAVGSDGVCYGKPAGRAWVGPKGMGADGLGQMLLIQNLRKVEEERRKMKVCCTRIED